MLIWVQLFLCLLCLLGVSWFVFYQEWKPEPVDQLVQYAKQLIENELNEYNRSKRRCDRKRKLPQRQHPLVVHTRISLGGFKHYCLKWLELFPNAFQIFITYFRLDLFADCFRQCPKDYFMIYPPQEGEKKWRLSLLPFCPAAIAEMNTDLTETDFSEKGVLARENDFHAGMQEHFERLGTVDGHLCLPENKVCLDIVNTITALIVEHLSFRMNEDCHNSKMDLFCSVTCNVMDVNLHYFYGKMIIDMIFLAPCLMGSGWLSNLFRRFSELPSCAIVAVECFPNTVTFCYRQAVKLGYNIAYFPSSKLYNWTYAKNNLGMDRSQFIKYDKERSAQQASSLMHYMADSSVAAMEFAQAHAWHPIVVLSKTGNIDKKLALHPYNDVLTVTPNPGEFTEDEINRFSAHINSLIYKICQVFADVFAKGFRGEARFNFEGAEPKSRWCNYVMSFGISVEKIRHDGNVRLGLKATLQDSVALETALQVGALASVSELADWKAAAKLALNKAKSEGLIDLIVEPVEQKSDYALSRYCEQSVYFA